jgi:hypothetical protein
MIGLTWTILTLNKYLAAPLVCWAKALIHHIRDMVHAVVETRMVNGLTPIWRLSPLQAPPNDYYNQQIRY